MGMNDTPSGERIHIGIFGRRNAGKSSLSNAITGQKLSIVSEVEGTTTDPVKKAMELLPLGPVLIMDTPGLDDEGVLGKERIKKTRQVLAQTDIALVVADGSSLLQTDLTLEKELIKNLQERKVPFLMVINKEELLTKEEREKIRSRFGEAVEVHFVSAEKRKNIKELKDRLAQLKTEEEETFLIRDIVQTGDLIVLVVPIDSAAPKGRLILPQQQVIRDCLEAGAIPIVTRETELTQTLQVLLKKPRLVVTDSQVFERVNKETPKDIKMTSFSMLFARKKGDLNWQSTGAKGLDELKDGDTVLIAEGCTHHRQCDDIGTVKMPAWILNYTGKKIKFDFTSGTEFPTDLSPYAMVIHCGGCTLNEKEMKHRLAVAFENKKKITNYGMAIAYMHGILERAMDGLKK